MASTLKMLSEKHKERHLILHGGEVFSLPYSDFEFFIKTMLLYDKRPSIQTSLGRLSPENLRLVKKYIPQKRQRLNSDGTPILDSKGNPIFDNSSEGLSIGLSVDGPKELNILRGPRDPEANSRWQDCLFDNIKRLRRENVPFGSISVLSKVNASEDKIDKLINWHVENKIGGRFNPMFVPWYQVNHPAKKYVLSSQELTAAFLKLYDAAMKYPEFKCALVEEMVGNLLGKDLASCILARCDYITTTCHTIMPNGGIARCDRCFQDGYFYRSEVSTKIRSEMLGQTECAGCRFWEVCGGGCPGEGMDGDFRNKTCHCEAYYALYEKIETNLRGLYPNIKLSIDIPNYYYDYYLKRKTFNPFENVIGFNKYFSSSNETCGQQRGGNHIDHLDAANSRHIDSAVR